MWVSVEGQDTEEVCRAILASPAWFSIGSPIWVRSASSSKDAILVFGDLDDASVARLRHVERWIHQARQRCKWYSYPDTVRLTEKLAVELKECLGSDISKVDWLAIPRGGLIVLGLLSYALGLRQERLENSLDEERPLVIIDDCALTGNRFSRFTEKVERKEVLFANLCSPLEVREAIVSTEPAVSHCLAADTLHNMAPTLQGKGYDGWEERVRAYLDTKRYWIGQSEIPIFPWSEPDHNFWNPITKTVESGWQVAPPELTLKSKHRESQSPKVFDIPDQKGVFLLGDAVLYYPKDSTVYIFDCETKAQYKLEKVGALLWIAFLKYKTMEDVVALVQSAYSVSPGKAKKDADRFAGQLLQKGLLQRWSQS